MRHSVLLRSSGASVSLTCIHVSQAVLTPVNSFDKMEDARFIRLHN